MLAIHRTAPLFFGVSELFHEIAKMELQKIEEKFKKTAKRRNRFENVYEVQDLILAFDDTGAAMSTLPTSFFVSLVGIYDHYVSELIREICECKPEVLATSEKSLKYSDILKFPDFAGVRAYCLEETADSVMRGSHVEQIQWLEEKTKVKLRPDDSQWGRFVEVTQRRHLCVHSGGKVNDYYLKNCRKQNVQDIDGLKVGDEICVDSTYCSVAFESLYTMGALVGQVLWRKYAPEDRFEADSMLNSISLQLIEGAQYTAAISLLEFAASDIRQFSSEEMRLMMLFNLAQAYKWSGNEQKLKKCIAGLDHTGLPVKFRLAKHCLAEEFDQAVLATQDAIKIGEIDKKDLERWPIFRDYRKSPEFNAFYRRRFKASWSGDKKDVALTPFDRLLKRVSENRATAAAELSKTTAK